MAPTLVTVTWAVPDASLGALGGTITFAPVAILAGAALATPVTITDTTDALIISPAGVTRLLSAGVVELIPTDYGAPSGWMYKVTTAVTGILPASDTYLIPHSPSPVDLSALVEAVAVEAVSPYALQTGLTAEATRAEAAEVLPAARQGFYYLDSYTGTDDQKMATALSAAVTAGNATIVLSPRAHTFANPWATSFVSSSTVTNIQIQGAGCGGAGGVVYPATGATTCTFTYAGGGGNILACMDFEHVGRLELAGILFVNTANPNPFLFSSNPTAEVHHCAFNGYGAGRAAAVTDAIIFGAAGFTQGGAAGQAAGFFGYGSKVHHSYFHAVRRVVSFGGGCNAVNVVENVIDQTCGNPVNWGAPFWFNGGQGGSPGNGANIIRHNYLEMTYYQSVVQTNGSARANGSVIGPNCLQDADLCTNAVWDSTCTQNWVDDTSQRTDQTFPSFIDYGQGNTSTGTNGGVSTQGTHARSTVFSQGVTCFSDFVVKSEGNFGAATEGSYGDAAWVTPFHNGSVTAAGVQFVGRQAAQVTDGSIISGSNVVTSVTAAFIQDDVGRYIYSASGIPQWSGIVLTAAPASLGFDWQASAAYTAGRIALPTAKNGHLYQCTTAGTTASTHPAWPVSGGTVTDGTAVWTDLGTSATAAVFSQAATATATGIKVNWGRTTTTSQTMLTVMNNHIMGSGSAPSYAAQTAQVGAGATATCAGNDMNHVVTLTTGSGAQSAGLVIVGTYHSTYSGSVPGGAIMLSAGNSAATAIISSLYVTNAGFVVNISSAIALTASTAYIINVMQVG